MPRVKVTKFREGAASFYVVAIATLILVVLATSFIAVVLSEVARTSNDDLSQSAYDSALAGIEDAKLAYYNYQSCMDISSTYPDALSTSPTVTCQDIVYWINHPDCDMVARILGRIGKNEQGGEVMIEETTSGASNNMQQAYTCNRITTSLMDYRSTVNESNSTRVVYVRLDRAQADQIKTAKISWYSRTDGSEFAFTNISGNKVMFPQLRLGGTKAATPPTISVGLVQTGATFSLEDFDKVEGTTGTNRGAVYLTPTDNMSYAKASVSDNHFGAYYDDMGTNYITAANFVKTNDRTVKNLPFVVYCPANSDSEFACSATMELPKVIGGRERNNETFMFVISIPYGQPSTDFSLEFFCADGTVCGKETGLSEEGVTITEDTNQATLSGVQVNIDSTGRANNLYRRVEARLDAGTINFPYPLYAIELLKQGSSSESLLTKPLVVTREYNF